MILGWHRFLSIILVHLCQILLERRYNMLNQNFYTTILTWSLQTHQEILIPCDLSVILSHFSIIIHIRWGGPRPLDSHRSSMHKRSKGRECIWSYEKAAWTCHNRFKYQFQLIDVTKFQQVYAAPSNKEVYLGDYGKTKDKPSIIGHIETVVVDFRAINNLGFEIKEKEKATKVLALSVRMFHFMHMDRRSLSHNESSKFNTTIFSGTRCTSCKRKTPSQE